MIDKAAYVALCGSSAEEVLLYKHCAYAPGNRMHSGTV